MATVTFCFHPKVWHIFAAPYSARVVYLVQEAAFRSHKPSARPRRNQLAGLLASATYTLFLFLSGRLPGT